MSEVESADLRFIIDEPAQDDFFKTHVPIARAIASSIENNPRLRVIGLLGRWGSGKSTIVKEVESQLANIDERYIVFTYDAWLHQNDPIRRSFIESIGSFLWEANVVDQGIWQTKIRQLSGGLEIISKSETPTVTTEAKHFFLLGIVASVGLVLAKGSYKDALKENFDDLSLWTLRFALALIALSVGYYCITFLYGKARGRDVHLVPNLLLNKGASESKIITQKPVDPSSIEFGTTFREIMEATASAGRAPVIVIDNIDRLDEAEALQIWASIRSFFLSPHSERIEQDQSYHPVVILPIDSMAILGMFSNGARSTAQQEHLAHSFINKTFDVTFNVPTPVMSDWKLFLRMQMEESFGSLFTESKYHATKSYLEKWLDRASIPITPREITKTLNRLIALLIQWKDSGIAYQSIAYYSINRRSIDADIRATVAEENNPLAANKNWQREIAALHFGVDVDHAAQVLMAEPIEKAFVSGDASALLQFQNVAGFGDTFEALTEAAMLDAGEIQPSFKVILNVSGFLEQFQNLDPWWYSSWRNVVKAFSRKSTFEPIAGMGPKITYLGQQVERSEAEEMVRALERLVDQVISMETLTKSQMENVGVVANVAVKMAQDHEVDLPIFDASVSANQYIKRLALLNPHLAAQRRMRTKRGHDELAAVLSGNVGEPEVASSVAPLLKLFTSADADLMIAGKLVNIDLIISAAENVIRSNPGGGALSSAAFETIVAVRPFQSGVKEALGRLVADGTMGAQLGNIINGKNRIAIAVAISSLILNELIIPYPLSDEWPDLFINNAGIDTDINILIDDLGGKTDTPLDKLVKLYDKDFKSRKLTKALFEERIVRGNLGRLYPDRMLKEFVNYSRLIDWKYRDRLVSLLASNYDRFNESVRTAELGQGVYEAADRLKRLGGEASAEFEKNLAQNILAIESESWLTAIISGAEPFNIVTKIVEPDILNLAAGSPLEAALTDAATRGLCRNLSIITRWFQLIEVIPSSGQAKAVEALYLDFTTMSAQQKLYVLNVGANKFVVLSKIFKSHDADISALILQLATLKEGRDWIKKRKSILNKVVKRLAPHDVTSLAQKIRGMHNSKNKDKQRWAVRMTRDWKMGEGEQLD